MLQLQGCAQNQTNKQTKLICKGYQWETSLCICVDCFTGFDQDVLLWGTEQQHCCSWGFALNRQWINLCVRRKREGGVNSSFRLHQRVKMRKLSLHGCLTVSLHGVSLSFFTFFPILWPGDKLHL